MLANMTGTKWCSVLVAASKRSKDAAGKAAAVGGAACRQQFMGHFSAEPALIIAVPVPAVETCCSPAFKSWQWRAGCAAGWTSVWAIGMR